MKKSSDPRIDIVGDTLYTHPLTKDWTEDQCWELARESVRALENNGYEIEQPMDTEGNILAPASALNLDDPRHDANVIECDDD